MRQYRYLLKNISLLAISNFGTKLLTFFLVPLYTNVLSTAEYGTYDLFSTSVNLMIPLVTANICDSILVYTLDKKNDRSSVFSIGLKYTIVGLVISFVLVMVNHYIGLFEALDKYWYYFPILVVINIANSNFSYCARGVDKVKQTAIGGIICSVVMIILNVILLLILKLGLDGYFLAHIIGITMQIIYLFFSCKLWQYIKISYSKSLEKDMKKYSIPMIANTIGWWIINASDRYVVTLLCGVAANGIYSVGYKIPSILNVFQSIFNQAWTISAVKDFDSEDKNGFFSAMYNTYNCSMVLVCAFIIASARLLARVLYAKEFFYAWEYVPFLTIAIVFGALSGYIGGIFAAVRESKVFGRSTAIGAITNLLLNIVLVKFLGPIGAAIATTIGYFIVFMIRINHVSRYIKLKINHIRDSVAYLLLLGQTIALFIMEDGVILYIIQFFIIMLIIVIFLREVNTIIQKILIKVGRKIKV